VVSDSVGTLAVQPEQELQKVLGELEASRALRRRVLGNLPRDLLGGQGHDRHARRLTSKAVSLKTASEGALRDRHLALTELVQAIGDYRTIAESKPLAFQGSEHPHAVHELNKAIDRAEALLQ